MITYDAIAYVEHDRKGKIARRFCVVTSVTVQPAAPRLTHDVSARMDVHVSSLGFMYFIYTIHDAEHSPRRANRAPRSALDASLAAICKG